jgi:predicted dehydrogenase
LKTVNLGIIGLGYIGQIHHKNSRLLPNAKVHAAADISKKALNDIKKAGVKNIYTDYTALLKDPEIDAVIIGLPTHLHLRCAVDAAEAGKDIFLEKPMARTPEECREIISVAQRHSVRLMMGYPLRFNDTLCALKEKINTGQIGEVENAHATFISTGPFFHRADAHSPVPVPDWWWNRELTGGGVLVDLGSHIINLLRWYFGEITDIKGYFGHRFNMDFEDSAMCLAKFTSKTVALVNVGWFSQGYTLKVDFLGSVKNESAAHLPSNNPFTTAIKMLATGRSTFNQPHLNVLKHFLECLINDTPPSPSGLDGLKDMEAIHMAYRNPIVLG